MKIKAKIDRMVNSGNVKAIASVSLDGMFVVKNLKIMDGRKGLFVSMPQETYSGKDGQKKYSNLFFALTNSAKLELQETVLQAYQQQIDPNYTPKQSYEEYSNVDTGESQMTIEMTADGLKEMNTAVYSDASMVNSGYSDCTLRITYAATVNSSADVVYGDNGNPNEVVLTWKRTSQNSYDTLKDDAKAFTYGLELTKLFSDGKGDFSKVQFIMQNKTDGYYVKAKLDEATGVYYVTDHVADKKDATRLVSTAKDGKGKILIKGLEDDEYTVTEIKTADGYTLLKKGIAVVISRKDASASATVDGKQAAMLADNGSANALVPLSVVNTSGFDLPATGDRGVWMYGLAGILLMTASAACIIIARKRFK